MKQVIWRQLIFESQFNWENAYAPTYYTAILHLRTWDTSHLGTCYNLCYVFFELSFFLQANMTRKISIIAHEPNYLITNLLLPNPFRMTEMHWRSQHANNGCTCSPNTIVLLRILFHLMYIVRDMWTIQSYSRFFLEIMGVHVYTHVPK